MLSQYLAQYLLNNNFLNADQVRDILENEQQHRVKLGVLAINKGVMNAVLHDFGRQFVRHRRFHQRKTSYAFCRLDIEPHTQHRG